MGALSGNTKEAEAAKPVPEQFTTLTCKFCRMKKSVKVTPKGEPRTPSGWHRQDEGKVCAECWKERYLLRAISIPVASPVDCSWNELRAALKTMWAQTTACANRIMTECYARDVRRNGAGRMPPMPRIYLYPELRSEFPLLPSRTVASLEQTCQRKYRALRYAIVWTSGSALPTYRYPTPFPIPNQGWTVFIEEERPIVSLQIGPQRLRLRLKTGAQFRRQYRQIQQIMEGEAVRGEAAIYQRGNAIMTKMVAWLPRKGVSEQESSTLTVRTASDKLLIAVNPRNEQLWVYNGDHLRRWSFEHRAQLQRWSEDAKYENRPVPCFSERRQMAARKYRNRMESATHEIAAQLAGYAKRRHFSNVCYNDAEHAFCEGFPWFRLRQLIEEKLNAHGIRSEIVGHIVAEEPLAADEHQ